ncbi:MAG: hypothetical protein ACJ768_24125 [Gaiellaceae bacterium]
MNTYPPLRGRGFGYGPGPFNVHEHAANAGLAWATFALVLLIVLTLGALLVARFSGGGRHHGRHFGPPMMRMRGGGRPDPLEILRMRFASGQITRDEFLQATGDLTATATTVEQPPPPAAAT